MSADIVRMMIVDDHTIVRQGQTNREIAASLYVSEGTIRNYVSIVLGKLEAANRAEASAYAVRHKLDDYLNSLK
jgi:DNA-binding NarL/FixJ family response regulator